MSEGDLQRKKANAPFADDVSADLILCTSDDVIFRVHKLILSKASPVFADILSLPHTSPQGTHSEEFHDGLPVIRLQEDSGTMDPFLRCCYPEPLPKLAPNASICALYRAGKKYDTIAVTSHVTDSLSLLASLTHCCLATYAISCHLGMSDCARKAAKQSLELSWNDVAASRFKEMDLIQATTFSKLLSYLSNCGKAVVDELLSPAYWAERSHQCSMFAVEGTQKCCEEYAQPYEGIGELPDFVDGQWRYDLCDMIYYAKKWAKKCLDKLADAVRRGDRPIRAAIGDSSAIEQALNEAYKCPTCSKTAVVDLLTVTKCIQDEIDGIINSVALEL